MMHLRQHRRGVFDILMMLISLFSLMACVPNAEVASPQATEQQATPFLTETPAPSLSPTEGASVSSTGQKAQGVVVIQGTFDPSGQTLLELKPVHQYSYQSEPIPNQKQGQYIITVTYVTGDSTVIPFDALIADDAGHTVHGFFEVTVPITGEIKSISITDAANAKTFVVIDGAQVLR
jgi:hypothetical protein